MKTASLNSNFKKCNGEGRYFKITINETDDPYYSCCQAQLVAGIIKDYLDIGF